MNCQDYWTLASFIVTSLAVFAALVGVAFAIIAWIEWSKLRELRASLAAFEAQSKKDLYNSLQATQLVIASYGVRSAGERASLLKRAAAIWPECFNVWNALGYAYLDNGEIAEALAAFGRAIEYHPHDKAGYCDMAWAYLKNDQKEKAVEWARKAIQADPGARGDLLADPRFAAIHDILAAGS